jgi:uncharacterized protein YjbJ (UPF0337 family)
MNWDIVKGNWSQLKGKVREKWGELTEDEYDQIAGQKDQFVGKLQEKYGYARDEAERHTDDFFRDHAANGTPDSRGVIEKVADAVTGDRVDDKTGKVVR